MTLVDKSSPVCSTLSLLVYFYPWSYTLFIFIYATPTITHIKEKRKWQNDSTFSLFLSLLSWEQYAVLLRNNFFVFRWTDKSDHSAQKTYRECTATYVALILYCPHKLDKDKLNSFIFWPRFDHIYITLDKIKTDNMSNENWYIERQ